MHPVLFDLPGGLQAHAYGVMVALGFLAALGWIRYQSRKENLPRSKMLDLAFLMLVAAVVGSRFAFIAVEWEFFRDNPGEIYKVWEGGLVFYGGLLACIPTAWIFLKRNRLSFWKVADVFMPGVALGHGLGRVGCFLAGCCYGRQCDPRAWYAVTFPGAPGGLAPAGVALYPTQLIEAFAEFLIFLILALLSRKKAFDGQILLLYLIFYSLLRGLIEMLRGDETRGFVIGGLLSTSQLISFILGIAALVVLLYRRGRSS